MIKQRGLGLGGVIVALFLVISGALFVFKLLPHYIEYLTIQKIFKRLAADPDLQTGNRREIVKAFERHATIDRVDSITGDDVEVDKRGTAVTISARYQVKTPLIANVTLLLDFSPSSGPN